MGPRQILLLTGAIVLTLGVSVQSVLAADVPPASSPASAPAASNVKIPADIIGWRQNWTGQFPNAQPPTTWDRTFTDSIVKGLKSQGKKPGDKLTEDAKAMADGLLLTFLAVGPFTSKEAGKGLEEAFIENQAQVQPDDGQAVGEKKWQPLSGYRANYPLNDQDPVFLDRALGKVSPGQVGYAHAYVYSDKGGAVNLIIDHTDGCKIWLNGKEIYNQPKYANAYGWWHWMSKRKLNYGDPSQSSRVRVELKKGWNNLLFKISAMQMEWGRGFAFLPRFTDVPPKSYDDKNILWVAPLCDTSNANPIVVGDKVFVLSEQDELICLDKKTGKQLWNRFNNYLEAASKADLDKPGMEDAKKLMDQLYRESDKSKRYAIQRQIQDILLKADKDKYEMVMEGHPEGHWFSTGFTTPSPMSDGKFVYVWVTKGVAACYDLDGKRQWIKRIDDLVKDPKDKFGPYFYPTGAVLSGGKLIFWDKEAFALDAKTGEIAWRGSKAGLGLGIMPAVIDGTAVVVTATDVFRASDGKVLWASKDRGLIAMGGPSLGDSKLLVARGALGLTIFDLSSASGESYTASGKNVQCGTNADNYFDDDGHNKKGTWRDQWVFCAPLYHDGLAYLVDGWGRLFVVDVNAGTLVYRQQLPLEPLVGVRSVAVASSPALGGKNIYVFDNQGTCVVFEPGRTYKQVARNKIETWMPRPHSGEGWQEVSTFAAPVFDGKCIYVRGENSLYCIGEK